MNESPIKPLLIFLVCAAVAFFLFAIIDSGLFTIGKIKSPPNAWIITTATIIGAVLSTNLGAVLGITVAPPNNPPQSQRFYPKVLGLRPSVSGRNANDSTAPQKMQILAAYFYVGSLILAVLFSLISHNDDLQFLTGLRNTFAGVLIGALTVALGK